MITAVGLAFYYRKLNYISHTTNSESIHISTFITLLNQTERLSTKSRLFTDGGGGGGGFFTGTGF
jgi:hypothetical protein